MAYQEHDTQRVFMDIGRVLRLTDPMFQIMAMGTLKLIQFYLHMVKEKKLSQRDFQSFQDFIKATDGKYDIVNLPDVGLVNVENGTASIPELKELGIRYCLLPDLNKEDGYLQVAVYQPDKEKFVAWQQRFLMQQMAGGEKNRILLRNLTAGQTTLVSVPLEGKEELFTKDFSNMGVNYSILPDLRVGDGKLQLMVANNDMQKVKHWYQLFKSDLLKRGERVADLEVIDEKQYAATGNMTEEQYIETATSDLKQAHEKYQIKEPGEIEKEIRQALLPHVRSERASDYELYDKDPEYVKISIDRKTLVEQASYSELGKDRGMFASRIPGTYGENEKTLIVNASQVFETADGKSYIAFLKKDHKPLVFDAQGKPESVTSRLEAEALIKKHYSKPMEPKKEPVQVIGKEKTQVRMPKVQVKVR